MIRNDEELKIVRMQLDRAESALASLRRDVLTKNANLYKVMSESYIDTVFELRGQVDAYLGIQSLPQTADLMISIEGEKVALGRTAAATVTRVIDTFRRGLQSAVEIVEAVKKPENARRRPRWIENICDLPLVGTAPGSVKILLSEPEAQTLFKDEDRELFNNALGLLFDGLAWADTTNSTSESAAFDALAPETKQQLLGVLTRLLPPQSGEVEQVAYVRRAATDHETVRSCRLTRDSRSRIRGELERLATDTAFVELEGVIRSVDLDAQSFALRERPEGEPDLPCEYGSDLEHAVKDYLDCRVLVSGTLETSQKTNKARLLADAIELVSGTGTESD